MEKTDLTIRKAINALITKLHLKLKESTVDSLIQFVKFGLVGVSNTVISYVLNVIVLLLLHPYAVSWDYIAGNVIAFILSVLWSHYWNNRFVFHEEGQNRNTWITLLKTYLAYGFTGIVLNNMLSHVWINVFGISKFIAPLINLFISVPLNFLINKLWTFDSKSKSH